MRACIQIHLPNQGDKCLFFSNRLVGSRGCDRVIFGLNHICQTHAGVLVCPQRYSQSSHPIASVLWLVCPLRRRSVSYAVQSRNAQTPGRPTRAVMPAMPRYLGIRQCQRRPTSIDTLAGGAAHDPGRDHGMPSSFEYCRAWFMADVVRHVVRTVMWLSINS